MQMVPWTDDRGKQKYVYTLDEAGKFLAWHSYKKDTTGWELDGLINSKVLLAKR